MEETVCAATLLLHGGPKKQDTQLLSISSPNIDRLSKFFHWYTQQEICNKDIITMASLHYFAKYRFTKIASTESTATADEACA